MKFLFDLFPVIVFVIAFIVSPSSKEGMGGDPFIASGAMIVAFVIQFAIMLIRKMKIEKMHKINSTDGTKSLVRNYRSSRNLDTSIARL